MAMCAMTRENMLASPAWVPKSYQCSARIPNGPGSLRRGIRFRVRGRSAGFPTLHAHRHHSTDAPTTVRGAQVFTDLCLTRGR